MDFSHILSHRKEVARISNLWEMHSDAGEEEEEEEEEEEKKKNEPTERR